MIVTEETKKAAQGVYDFIMMNPERHNQAMWISGIDGAKITEANVCNTTLCAAGAAILLNQGIEGMNACYDGENYWDEEGAKILGLETNAEIDALFFESNNEQAKDMLLAIANGDEDKFRRIAESMRVAELQAELEADLI